MTVFNGGAYVEAAIRSILGQTFREFEFVVLDDGSSDGTGPLLDEVARHDDRVRLYRQDNAGFVPALNRAWPLARAPLIARIDADDLARPDRLERQVFFLREHREVAVLGGAVDLITESGSAFATASYPITDEEVRRRLVRSCPFVHSSVMLRRSALERAGGYRPTLGYAADYDLWLRLAESHRLANLPDTIGSYRIHRRQASALYLRQEILGTLAARAAAALRAAGSPDPLFETSALDARKLAELGVGAQEIARETAMTAAWWARTTARAGYQRESARLWSQALVAARRSASRALLVDVVRRRAACLHEQGSRRRARLSLVAALARQPTLLGELRGAQRVARRSPSRQN